MHLRVARFNHWIRKREAMLRLHLTASAVALELAGGDLEFRPFLAYHATWSTNRVPKVANGVRAERLDLAPLALDPNALDATPYEAIWIQVMAWSRRSGDPELEHEERGRILRTIECGTVRVALTALLHPLLRGSNRVRLELPMHDYRAEAYLRDPDYPSKGTVVLEGRLDADDSDLLMRYARWLRGARPRELTGAHPGPIRPLLSIYARYFFGEDALYPARTPLLRKLHLAMYRSNAGMLPPVGFWLNNSFMQQERIDFTLHEFGDSLRVYFEGLLEAQCQRHGFAPGELERLVHEQYEPENLDTFQPGFARALDVVIQAASSIVYGAHYMADMRYEAHSRRPLFLESFDTPLDGIRNGIDCEDLENAISVTIHTIKCGAQAWRRKHTLWEALHRLLAPYVIYDTASLATTAFADPHRRGELVFPSELSDLPRLDSAQDRKSEDIGHCPGWMIPRVIVQRAALAGNVRRSDAAHFFSQETHPFEHQLRIAVLEGTGPTDTYVMPLERAYGNDLKSAAFQDAALRLFAQAHLERQAPELTRPPFMRRPGPFYYYDRKLQGRRLSDFYHEVAHGVSAELYRENPVLSQMTFVNPDGTYGVRVEDLFAEHHRPHLRFVAPFVEEQTLWAREIAPHLETVLRQLPLTLFSHFTPETLSKTSPRLQPLEGVSAVPVEKPYSANGILPVVTFTTDREAVTQGTQLAQQLLEANGEVVGYQWFRSRTLPQLSDVYELHMYVDRAQYAERSQDAAAVLAGRIPGGFQTRINAR